jgi:anti-sigma B factor antagonist
MQGIQIQIHQVGARLDLSLITVSGYIDTTTCPEMAGVIQDLMRQKKVQIIVDLGRVTYISSAGWGVFVGEIKNIREQGGDLKFVRMVPEVAEVFEMLEFHKILNTYESVEEAVDEFDLLRGIDITETERQNPKSPSRPPIPVTIEKPPAPPGHHGKRTAPDSDADADFSYKDFPVVERIKKIVIENPMAGLMEIRRRLGTEKYGHVRIGTFRLFSLLRNLNLETREKRHRFYRSR